MQIKKKLFSKNKILKLTGSELLCVKPIFTEDGTSLIVGAKTECHQYNTETGEHMGYLFSCDSTIIAVQINPNDSKQILAFTDKGRLYSYHTDTGNEEHTRSLKLDHQSLADIPKFCRTNLYRSKKERPGDWASELSTATFFYAYIYQDLIYASWCVEGESFAHLSTFYLETGEHVSTRVQQWVRLQKKSGNFAVGNDMVMLMGPNYIYLSCIRKLRTAKHMVHADVACVDISKEGECVATGDSSGRITIWRNIFRKQPLREIYHWHHLPVGAITFSEHGSHIFSGGEENVLVKWSLATQSKTFLPRLSSHIRHIAISPASGLMAVSTTDSRILIVNLNMTCLATIQHFSSWSNVGLTNYRGLCTQDPRSSALVIGGRTGHLQFISMVDGGRFLYTVDITCVNYKTRKSFSKPNNVEIRCVKFSRCGKWMISTESDGLEGRLKFWFFDAEKQKYTLNTNVEIPHGNDVTCLEVSSDDTVVTTGPDNKFRLWGIVELINLRQTVLHWAQIGHGSFRHLPVNVADFSRDGSVVGVGFGPTLTVWDTDNSILKCNLTSPLKREALEVIRFGNLEMSHLVITGTTNEVTSWNLVTLCIQWVVPLNVSTIIKDFATTYMCAFSKKHGLFIFQPSSPSPEIRLDNVCESEVIGAVFVNKADASEIYFITQDQTLFCYGEGQVIDQKHEKQAQMTPFSALQPLTSSNDVQQGEQMDYLLKTTNSTPMNLLKGGPHSQPPISLLCTDLLRSLLLTIATPEPKAAAIEDEDIVVIETVKPVAKATVVDETVLKTTVDRIFRENVKKTKTKKNS